MYISRVRIQNYRCLRLADVTLNKGLNIVVGQNECGKSTLLEAIHLALSGQLNGRPIQSELHPHLFHAELVREYISALKAKEPTEPPLILIELYFPDDPKFAKLKGTNNELHQNVPGISLSIEFNADYTKEYTAYVADPTNIRTLPIEYYIVRWRDFADNDVTSRSVPIKPSFIDASTIRNNAAASRYVVDIIRDSLSSAEKVDLALSYRLMKDAFLSNGKVKAINTALSAKKGDISEKSLTVSLDTSSRATWEAGVMPHLDDIPLPMVGKGEQNTVKIKLALESSAESQLVLIEEPENHLSFSNLNKLIAHISERSGKRQLIITTHSSFVMNKLGIESVVLFKRGASFRLNQLTPGTQDYFMKLPGHDTLRLILSTRAILVEGPSDELIVQIAYFREHKKTPLQQGVDVISVNSLAFKRFLEIAVQLGHPVTVITDNDGDVAALNAKYKDFLGQPNVKIVFDKDESYQTLEPQLLKASGRSAIEKVIGKAFANDGELLHYMKSNKSDTALAFFRTHHPWIVPEYIRDAVR